MLTEVLEKGTGPGTQAGLKETSCFSKGSLAKEWGAKQEV